MRFLPPDNVGVYEQAARTYAARVMQFPSTLAVYQLGTINEPGVSDLDIIVVVRSTCADVAHLSIRYILQDEPQFLAVFLHDVAIFDENTYKDLRSIYYVSQLSHLAGEKLDFGCNISLSRNACIANLIDFSLPRIHRLGQLVQKKAPPGILLLLSLAYIDTVKLAEKIGIASPASLEFCNRAVSFRREAKDRRSDVDILTFCNETRLMFARTLNAVAGLIPVKQKSPPFAFLYNHEQQAITFFRECDDTELLCGDSMLGIPDSTWLVVSANLYWYYHTYANSGGSVGTAARRALAPICKEPGLSEPFLSFLHDRVIWLNRRIDYLRKVNGTFSDIIPRPGFNTL